MTNDPRPARSQPTEPNQLIRSPSKAQMLLTMALDRWLAERWCIAEGEQHFNAPLAFRSKGPSATEITLGIDPDTSDAD